MSAEGVFRFILDELRGQNTIFSAELEQAVQKRLEQRRNKYLVGLLIYLKNYVTDGKVLKTRHPFLLLPSKSEVQSRVRKLFCRLFNNELGMSMIYFWMIISLCALPVKHCQMHHLHEVRCDLLIGWIAPSRTQ